MNQFAHLALASVSLLALSTPAFAQDATSEDGLASNSEIVVTARRRDESAQDVPLVVNAVTADKLEKLNIQKFEDVVKVVPGLTIQQNANGIGSTTTVRGVKYDINASGNNGTVEYYLNDAPISAGFVLQSLFDVGQIELLRGPQGTLRGRSAPSGAITVTTRKPDLNEVGGYVMGTGTESGNINAQAAVGVPIIPGVLAVRVAGIIDNNNFTDVHSIYNAPNPYSKTRAVRASMRFDPFDGLSINVMYSNLRQKLRSYDQVESVSLTNTEIGVTPTSPFGGTTLVTAEQRLGVSNHPRNIQQDFEALTGSLDWQFAGQRLVYVFGTGKQHILATDMGDRGDVFGSAYSGNSFLGVNLDQLQNYGQSSDTGQTQSSHEIRLQSDDRLFGMVDYVVGGLISHANSPTTLALPTPVFCGGGIPVVPCSFAGSFPTPSAFLQLANTSIINVSTTSEHSIFGNVTLHFGEATEVSGGARYIMYSDTGLTKVGSATIRDTANDYSAWIYTASAKHRFSDNLMVYGMVGSSWRPPANAVGDFSRCSLPAAFGGATLYTPVLSCTLEQSFLRTQPERSTSYEIGFKSNWFDRKVTLNATVFHQKFNNFVYRAPGSGAPFVNYSQNSVTGLFSQNVQGFNFINGVPVKVTGVEAEMSWAVTPNFDLGASFTYAVGKINNGLLPCADANDDGIPDTSEALPDLSTFNAIGQTIQACTVNQRANDAPVFSGNIQAEYRMPISDNSEAFLRGLFTYYGSSQGNPLSPYDDVSAYGLLDLFVGLRDAGGVWEVQAFAKNLTDTYRRLTASGPITTSAATTNGQSINAISAYRTISSTAPREFGLSVRYAFGGR